MAESSGGPQPSDSAQTEVEQPSAPPPPPLPRPSLADYEQGRELGRGTFGSVVQGVHKQVRMHMEDPVHGHHARWRAEAVHWQVARPSY